MSLANQVLDFYDDVSREMWQTVATSGIPAHVKTAAVSEPLELMKLGSSAYALSTRLPDGSELNKFPVFTKADTWISAQYFSKTAHKLPEGLRKIAQANLDKAMKQHGLGVMKKEATYRPEHYALKDKYPIDSAVQVKLACAYFEEWKSSFSLSDRREYATKVASRAKQLGVADAAGPSLRKYAGSQYGTEVNIQLKLRQELVGQTDHLLSGLSKLAAVRDQVEADKFAEMLAAFDREAGLEKYHNRFLADPYVATFEEKEFRKVASGYNWEDESTGLTVSESDLKKVAHEKSEKLKGFLGETVAREMKKHGYSIFDSLPIDAKIVVAKIAKGLI